MNKANNIKTCDRPLRSNPFTAYRDSQTGMWVVRKSEEMENYRQFGFCGSLEGRSSILKNRVSFG